MTPKTHCRHGHSRAEHSYTDKKGTVVCRQCRRLKAARIYQEHYKGGTGHRVPRQAGA